MSKSKKSRTTKHLAPVGVTPTSAATRPGVDEDRAHTEAIAHGPVGHAPVPVPDGEETSPSRAVPDGQIAAMPDQQAAIERTERATAERAAREYARSGTEPETIGDLGGGSIRVHRVDPFQTALAGAVGAVARSGGAPNAHSYALGQRITAQHSQIQASIAPRVAAAFAGRRSTRS